MSEAGDLGDSERGGIGDRIKGENWGVRLENWGSEVKHMGI